ncbi:MAG: Gfo/Idh/MocA family oxidoreductase [Candidatus Omnitrophica bacterium]|nr:Gfo/Idh/MocA family oxidoreductase [Candidatus Omnitrophota bacterium]
MKKILVVGGGGIGRRHIDGLLRTGKFQVSVCEVDNEKLIALKKEYPLESIFSDFFSTNIVRFDAVLIATPANFHLQMAKKCCLDGVPFLVEKPLSVTLDGVNELIDIAKKNKIVCGVAYTRRSVPSFRKFREIAQSDIIGEIKMANFYCAQDYRKYRPDYEKIYFSKKAMAGGVLRDFITHFVDLAQWMLGKPEKGFCISENLVFGDSIETDDSAVVIGKFSKKIVSFYCNGFQKPNELIIDFAGTKGNLKYVLITRHLSRILFADDDSGRWEQLEEFQDEGSEYYLFQAQHLLRMLDGLPHDFTTLQEAAENLEFIIKLNLS